MLVDDIVKEFIFELQVQNYTPRIIKGYKNNILGFKEFCKQEFEVFELEEINHIHIYKSGKIADMRRPNINELF